MSFIAHQDQEEVVRQIRLGYKVNVNMENKCGLNVDVAAVVGELYLPMFIPCPHPEIELLMAIFEFYRALRDEE